MCYGHLSGNSRATAACSRRSREIMKVLDIVQHNIEHLFCYGKLFAGRQCLRICLAENSGQSVLKQIATPDIRFRASRKMKISVLVKQCAAGIIRNNGIKTLGISVKLPWDGLKLLTISRVNGCLIRGSLCIVLTV